ncbi:L-threonine 3-dehydrogenase [Desulfobacterales bacterium RS19-109]|uniref:L-threonine 3-dehydrogenase n=2 Tax=Thiovibrio frasassiensis TaxID=2984131 RepID=A0A9X4RNA7_9BACT|nr:L-threonine 3-dehydrogenase [Thiovibrio frasassiensis]MDG4477050.1 L-threonine 3-dehydrogenase [Thiovibrio frasassiensis]
MKAKDKNTMHRILVTGATGQIGSELVPALRARYGAANVIAVGHKKNPASELRENGPYAALDIRERNALAELVERERIDTIYHLAALLSATAEADPQLAWEINMGGLLNVLEVARLAHCGVFHPSSIGAFGPSTPRDHTPQVTIQRPNTMYGVTKVSGELLCDYYHHRYGLDTRGIRFPGLISHKTQPGGGTTDYAVEIFAAALSQKQYTCFLQQGTRLDMMYMPDAIRAAMEIMEAEPARLHHRNAYNLTAMSFAPETLGAEIGLHIPGFTISYQPDPVRQAIADSWPNSLDDSAARADWDWRPRYGLREMTREMLGALSAKESRESRPFHQQGGGQ